jgi:hypothetical protein
MSDNLCKSDKRTMANADAFDLDSLLHPAKAFGHPLDVVNDADLTLNEKRAILSSWASVRSKRSPLYVNFPPGRLSVLTK